MAMRFVGKGLAVAAAVGLLALGTLLAALSVERRTETTLPAPTGPFAVGRVIDVWTDPATVDTLAPVPGATRELLAWIWYPAAASSAAPDDYVPARMRAAAGPPSGPMALVTRDASKLHVHSIRDAEVSPRARTYPVLIMRGGASAGVVGYSALAEELASHGYVVVGFDAPYRSSVVVFPDGRVLRRLPANNPELCAEQPPAQQEACIGRLLTAWTADVGYAVDRLERMNRGDPPGRFTGRLDTTRIGVFGHSLGGSTAAQFCHDDARCKAAVDIDGNPFGSVVREGMHRPFMFLMSDHGTSSDPASREIWAKIQSTYDRLPALARQRIVIRGSNHFLFSDDGAVMKSRILLGALRTAGIVGIDGRRQLDVAAYCVRRFFDAYLTEGRTSPIAIASPLYPEVQVLE